MKNKEIISGVVGASFFAIGYIGLSIAALPALAVGTTAYVASSLILSGNKEKIENIHNTLEKRIAKARKDIKHINEMIKEVDDKEVKKYLDDISVSSTKIINTIEKNKIDNKTSNKFLDYYLPVCVNILDRYDEIENQELTSKDSIKFMEDSNELIKETSLAFKKILNSLYQNDIENNEAEMKVYNQMLKSDGYNANELEVKDGAKDE
jgi:5-bromo-4-chloroindolyl phosphate hydrolysis protein